MNIRNIYNQALSIVQSKRGAMGLDAVPGVAIAFVVIAVIFVVGYLVLAGLTNSITANSVANNNTIAQIGNLSTGLDNIVTFAPTWGTVIGAAVILAIVVGGLYFFMRGNRGGGL